MSLPRLEAGPEASGSDSRLSLLIERIDIGSCGGFVSGIHEKGSVAEAFQLLKTISHPNICCYTDLLRIGNNVYVLASEGYSITLEDVIRSYVAEESNVADGITHLDVERTVHQIICGLQFLHASGVPHGSLGLHNIFINRKGDVKIGCYAKKYLERVVWRRRLIRSHKHDDATEDSAGDTTVNGDCQSYCNKIKDTRAYRSRCHLHNNKFIPYHAPEVFAEKGHYEEWNKVVKKDVWSLGVCLMQIIAALVSHDSKETSRGDSENEASGHLAIRHFYMMIKRMQCPKGSKILGRAFFAVSSILSFIGFDEEPLDQVSSFGLDLISMGEEVAPVPEEEKGTTQETSDRVINLLRKVVQPDGVQGDAMGFSCVANNVNNDDDDYHALETHWSCGKELGGEDIVPDAGDIGNLGQNEALEISDYVAAVEDVLDWVTQRKLVQDLIYLTRVDMSTGKVDLEKEKQPAVTLVYYLLSIASRCLTINPNKRPSSLDLLSMLIQRHSGSSETKGNNESLEHARWHVASMKDVLIPQVGSTLMPIRSFLSRRYLRPGNSIAELEQLDITIDDVFYIWRLMGNDPVDLLAVNDYQSDYPSCGYSRQLVSLQDVFLNVKRADLVPVIIEHQVRPTCAYARQFSFLYQLMRIRRFEKLLCSDPCAKSQIIVESQIDVPPLLRKHVWSVILGVDRPFRPSMSTLGSYQSTDVLVTKEIEKVLQKYNNDILHSQRCLDLMTEATILIKDMYSLDSLPSSIYHVWIPLALLYYDVSELFMEAVRIIFDKYLIRYYIPSGSFVQNELAEFNTLLNFFDPEVAAHLRRLGAFAESFVLIWFMTLFSEAASHQQVFVLWDTMMCFPRNYVKYIAVTIIKSVREGILDTTTASCAISYITGILDSIHIPMLNYRAIQLYSFWNGILFPKAVSKVKSSCRARMTPEITPASDMMSIVSDASSIMDEKSNIESITFPFNMENYPYERCFKLTLKQFSELLDICVIVDLRSLESHKLGHIPSSCHIDLLLKCLKKRDEEAISTLAKELVKDQGETNTPDNNKFRRNEQVYGNVATLMGNRKHIHDQDSKKDTTILLAVGDGVDQNREMIAVETLIFSFHMPHVCYYRINGEDWPKFFTLSKI